MEFYQASLDALTAGDSNDFYFRPETRWGHRKFYLCGFSFYIRDNVVMCLHYYDKWVCYCNIAYNDGTNKGQVMQPIVFSRDDFMYDTDNGWYTAYGSTTFPHAVEIEENEVLELTVINNTGVDLAHTNGIQLCVWGYSVD